MIYAYIYIYINGAEVHLMLLGDVAVHCKVARVVRPVNKIQNCSN